MLTLAIPTFHGERYLEETLRSLNGEGEAVRWWLQDGNSADRTVEIARSYARPGDTVVTEPDQGQADALNRSMARMGGEIIGFINGDDCLKPGAARRVLDYFDSHPEIDLVYGEIEWIDSESRSTGFHAGRIDSLGEALDVYGVWWKQRQWVQPEVFYRRSLWEKVGGFDTRYHLVFDYDFWVRCFLAGARVARLPVPLAQFRLHAAQKSSAAARAAEEIRDSVERHLKTAPILEKMRARLKAQISYERYHLGLSRGRRRPFWLELLRHPGWLRVPEVRDRLQIACTARFSRARNAQSNPST